MEENRKRWDGFIMIENITRTANPGITPAAKVKLIAVRQVYSLSQFNHFPSNSRIPRNIAPGIKLAAILMSLQSSTEH